jgi:hypothetical protein
VGRLLAGADETALNRSSQLQYSHGKDAVLDHPGLLLAKQEVLANYRVASE